MMMMIIIMMMIFIYISLNTFYPEGTFQLLFCFVVLGCPDIKIPPGTTSERSEDGNTLTVSCINVLQTWHLTCGGLAWVGEIGVCKTGE